MWRFLATTCLAVCLGSSDLLAATSYQIASGNVVEIDEHGTCWAIENNHPSGKAIMVPTNTELEWDSYIAHLPTGVTNASCDPCHGTPAVGTVCLDGTVYAGVSPDGSNKMYATRCDAGMSWDGSACTGTRSTIKWSTGTSIVTGYTSAVTGRANTAGLAALSNADSPYAAAIYCDGLTVNGKNDWYLPAKDELNLMYVNRTAIGGFDAAAIKNYWTGSEYTNNVAWIQRSIDGSQSTSTKNTVLFVRCARRGIIQQFRYFTAPRSRAVLASNVRMWRLPICKRTGDSDGRRASWRGHEGRPLGLTQEPRRLARPCCCRKDRLAV